MKMVNIQEAKTNLSRLTEEAAGGEEIILAKAGKPVAKLVGFEKPKSPRKGGSMRGLVVPDDFDAPSPEIEALFNQ
ncbi:MAG: putative Antitoxin of toxin-antitoxin system phd type [Puniceicoccaceae bacterium 5H]|nr:MAG: putative Antitoxin of toxin-antitoxin system phd type [Puniceicoccaceae bacterium 5H]